MKNCTLYLTSLALLLVTSCATSYQLGSQLPEGISSVHIPTAKNETGEPLIETEVTRAIKQAIQRDGSLTIAKETTADAVLDVTLTEYTLLPMLYDENNPTLARQYRVIIYANMHFYERVTGETIVRYNRIQGNYVVNFGGDLSTAKRLSLDDVAEDLGYNIVEQIVEYWK